MSIDTASLMESEYRVVDAYSPFGTWNIVYERKENVYYTLEHWNEYYIICIRDEARPNSEIIAASIHNPNIRTVSNERSVKVK